MRNGFKVFTAAAAALTTMCLAGAASAQPILGDQSACNQDARGPAVLVRADGFRDRQGNLRIAIYRAIEDEYLASGKFVARHDFPMSASGSMTACVPLKEKGRMIIVALHDRNSDGKLNVWSDGFGFSRNPRLGTSKPKIEAVEVNVDGVLPLAIRLNYVQGLSARPWRQQ